MWKDFGKILRFPENDKTMFKIFRKIIVNVYRKYKVSFKNVREINFKEILEKFRKSAENF